MYIRVLGFLMNRDLEFRFRFLWQWKSFY